jgi:hypothetical protein
MNFSLPSLRDPDERKEVDAEGMQGTKILRCLPAPVPTVGGAGRG